MVIYEGRGVRSFLDVAPCVDSSVAEFLQNYPVRTHNMIAHIRCATHGCTSLENVHPFIRELWGIQWCFVHNGEAPEFACQRYDNHVVLGKADATNLSYHSVGDTDSEAVFCAILDALKAEFNDLPSLPVLYTTLNRLCDQVVEEHDTIFNFLMTVGEYTLFAFSWPGQKPDSDVWNGLYTLTREAPFSTATLLDEAYSIDFSKVNDPMDRVTVVATRPLTDEDGWKEMKKGELIVFDKGVPYSSARDLEHVEQQGRGLSSRCFRKSKQIAQHQNKETVI